MPRKKPARLSTRKGTNKRRSEKGKKKAPCSTAPEEQSILGLETDFSLPHDTSLENIFESMDDQISGANTLTDDEMETLIKETEKSFSETEAMQDQVGEDITTRPGPSGLGKRKEPSSDKNNENEIERTNTSNKEQAIEKTNAAKKQTLTPHTQNTSHIDADVLEAFDDSLQELVDNDRDPDYVPEVRKSSRLKDKDRFTYSLTSTKIRDPERIQREGAKKQFYDAIRMYGTKDVKSVVNALPDRTEESVKRWIQIEKNKQVYTNEKRATREDGTYEIIGNVLTRVKETSESRPESRSDTPESQWRENFNGFEMGKVKIETNAALDKWIENVESVHDKFDKSREKSGLPQAPQCQNMIPNSLNWIAEFEEHPDPDTCGGIDYAAIYRYFSCLAEGEVPPDLNPVSATRVTRLLSDLSYLAIGNMNDNENEYLQNYKGPQTRYATTENYDEKSKGVLQFEKMNGLSGMNPLNMHPELCTDKQIDLSKLSVVVNPGVLQLSQSIPRKPK